MVIAIFIGTYEFITKNLQRSTKKERVCSYNAKARSDNDNHKNYDCADPLLGSESQS